MEYMFYKRFDKVTVRWLVYRVRNPDKYFSPWQCPVFDLVAGFLDKADADEFAARAPADGEFYYHVKSADRWKGGGKLKEPVITIPFELFRKIVVYFSFGLDEEERMELHNELNEIVAKINPKDYSQP